ncbi:hypothetical protein D3C76_852710 [compost metagenome]
MQRLARYADVEQRLPERRQFVQRFAHLLLLVRRADQLIERQITLELFQACQLIQSFSQSGLTFEQLLLIGGAYQEELAGGLIAGDSGNGLGFVGQLLRCADPLADVVFAAQLQQPAHAKGDQQRQQDWRFHLIEQRFTTAQQKRANTQWPLRRTQLHALEQGRQQAHGGQISAEQTGGREHGNLGQRREGRPGQGQVADTAGDQAQGQPWQGQAQGRPAVPGFQAPAFGQVMQRVVDRHTDQARTQYQRHHMHMAEQRHAGHRTEEHAHQHRHEGQQNAPAPEGQQQQQQNPHGGTATDPGHLPGGLLLPAGCVQQAAGGE